jgi:transposase
MVREALADTVPKERLRVERARRRLEPAIAFIDAILENHLKAPRKQRHTAHRVYDRPRAEKPEIAAAEATVRAYVREKKLKIGLIHRETFVPQSYTWGHEGQVDWYEMYAELGGETQKVQMFCLRSMASAGGVSSRAYPHASQQAFLEAHELAFHYFGGTFQLLRCDNLKSAVQRILRGSQREETARFIAFRSHWSYEAEFCNRARGNEKGGVEGEGGFFRRNHLVPVPVARDYAHLNELLRETWKLAGAVTPIHSAARAECGVSNRGRRIEQPLRESPLRSWPQCGVAERLGGHIPRVFFLRVYRGTNVKEQRLRLEFVHLPEGVDGLLPSA